MSMYFPKRLELSFRIVLAFPKAEGPEGDTHDGSREGKEYSQCGRLGGLSEKVVGPRTEQCVGLHWTAAACKGMRRGTQSVVKVWRSESMWCACRAGNLAGAQDTGGRHWKVELVSRWGFAQSLECQTQKLGRQGKLLRECGSRFAF